VTPPGVIHDHQDQGEEYGGDLRRCPPLLLEMQGVEVGDAVEAPEVEDVLVDVQREVEEEGQRLEDRVGGGGVASGGDGEVEDEKEVDGHCRDVEMLMD
jgi:hypothetical protein